MNSIEDKYLNILKRKFNIKELDIKLFMSKLLNIICNQLITNNTKENYLKKYSDNQVILNTLEDLGYYLIKSSNDESIKTKWNLIINIIDNFKEELKNITQIKDIILSLKNDNKSNESNPQMDYFFNILLSQFVPKTYPNTVIGKLQNIINNNKTKLNEFKISDTLITLNKGLVNELNKLNANISCVNSNGEIILSNEITHYYKNHKLIINLSNIDFFMNNLNPKYSSYILSLFFSTNNKYVINYIYCHINTYSLLSKTNQLKSNEIILWDNAIKTILSKFSPIFDEYLGKLIDYCNLKDLEIKYETINYYLQDMIKIENIKLNYPSFQINNKIMLLLCSCFDLKVSTKYDNNTNTEYYKINSNRIINNIVNKEILIKVTYNNSITFDTVTLNELNTILISIPSFITTNNNYNNTLLIYLNQLITIISNVLFDLINPSTYYIQDKNLSLYRQVFNKFSFIIIYNYLNVLFDNDVIKIKKYISILKALEYNNILINLVFQSNLLDDQLNKSLVNHIKKFAKELQDDKLILQNTIELIQKYFNEVYENIFGYTYKMNIFNPLLTFDKDYLIDMKIEIYTCSIFKHFKNQIINKKKNNIECSSVYQIMDIDDFNNFIIDKKNEINMNDIISIYFSNKQSNNTKEEEMEDELMTETCYDINNVVTKEDF